MGKKLYPSHLSEKGLVLVTGLIIMTVLMMLGTGAFLASSTDLRVSGNYRANLEAFHIAEAGSEVARERIREAVAAGNTLTSLLTAARGANALLTASEVFHNFYQNGAFISDDVPYIASTSFSGGSYRVYLTNDTAEGTTSATDANTAVTLTAFGLGRLNSLAVVQTTIRRLVPPDLPGAIVLPGPNVSFAGGNSSAQVIHGMSKPAVAVNSAASLASVITGIPRPDSYRGNCPGLPCVGQAIFPYPWNSLPGLRQLAGSLAAQADFTSTSAPGFSWGTTASPRIVFIDGNLTIGPISGAGIIIVTGDVSIHGNFDYSGLILAIGRGRVDRHGGGNGLINGSIFAANIAGADGVLNTADDVWGNPHYDTSGGGTSDITYNAAALENNTSRLPFVKTTWRRSGS